MKVIQNRNRQEEGIVADSENVLKAFLIELMCRDDWSFENVHAMDVTQGENKEKTKILSPILCMCSKLLKLHLRMEKKSSIWQTQVTLFPDSKTYI